MLDNDLLMLAFLIIREVFKESSLVGLLLLSICVVDRVVGQPDQLRCNDTVLALLFES